MKVLNICNVIRDETEHFINSVKNNRQTCYPFHQALNDLKIILDMRNFLKLIMAYRIILKQNCLQKTSS